MLNVGVLQVFVKLGDRKTLVGFLAQIFHLSLCLWASSNRRDLATLKIDSVDMLGLTSLETLRLRHRNPKKTLRGFETNMLQRSTSCQKNNTYQIILPGWSPFSCNFLAQKKRAPRCIPAPDFLEMSRKRQSMGIDLDDSAEVVDLTTMTQV